MALALATQPSAAIPAAPSTPLGCPAPQLGGYVVAGQGRKGAIPLAELAQERWLPNGRIEGVRFSRQGKLFEEQRYLASYAVMPGCWVAVQRADRSGVMPSQVALDGAGRPKVGISTTAGVVFTELLGIVRNTGAAALVATHNPELADRMDRTLRLSGGLLVEDARVGLTGTAAVSPTSP